MTKAEILCYWGERLHGKHLFTSACIQRNIDRNPQAIARRQKKERKARIMGDRKGQLAMFPPDENEVTVTVVNNMLKTNEHFLRQLAFTRTSFYRLRDGLEDGRDYDTDFLVGWGLPLEIWLDRMSRGKLTWREPI